MKELRSLINSFLVGGLALTLTCAAGAQTVDRTVKVYKVAGDARYTMNNGTDWQKVEAGTVLKPGVIIQTSKGEDTYVDLVLGEGKGVAIGSGGAKRGLAGGGAGGHRVEADVDMVRLHGDTALGIDKLTVTPTAGVGPVTDTELDLRKGHITGNVKKMTAGSVYEIKYAKGVAGIRGSVYDMALVQGVQNGTITVNCVLNMTSGSAVLSFTDATGQVVAQTVLPGFGVDTSTGAVAPIPQAILNEIVAALNSMNITAPTQVTITVQGNNQNIIQQVTTTVGGP